MTPAEIKALVERVSDDPKEARDHPLAVMIRDALEDHLRGASRITDDASTFAARRVASALRSFMDGGWRPIAEYEGCGPALVSTAPQSRRELFSEPVSAFRDVTGVWRCLGSIGGMAELSRQPTHFRPLPTPPAVEGEAGE